MRSWLLVSLGIALSGELYGQRVELTVPLPDLERQAAVDSNDTVRHYEVALGYLLNGRFDDAERSLKLALEIDPGNAAAYLALGFVPFARTPRLWELEEINEKTPPETVRILEESARLRRRAFMLDPLVDLRVLGAILPPHGKVGGGSGDLGNALLLGFENFWVGNHAESFRLLHRVLGTVPDRRKDRIPSFLFWYHGLAAAHVGDYAVASSDFSYLLDRAVRLEQAEDEHYFVQDPFRASNDYRYFLGTIKARAGLADEATLLLQQCIEQDLSLYPAHSQLAAIYESRRDWASAVKERQRALDANPDDPALLFDLGSTLSRAGQILESIDVLNRAMAANPRNPRIPYLLGSTALRMGQDRVARDAFQRFLGLAPSRFATQARQVRSMLEAPGQ